MRALFALARSLHMTVTDMQQRMTAWEFAAWFEILSPDKQQHDEADPLAGFRAN
jgi:hypothetical protein